MYRAMTIRKDMPEFTGHGLYIGYTFNLSKDKTDNCYYMQSYSYGAKKATKLKIIEADGVTLTELGKACEGYAYLEKKDSWFVDGKVDKTGKIKIELKPVKQDVVALVKTKKQAIEKFLKDQENYIQMAETDIDENLAQIQSAEQDKANSQALMVRAIAFLQNEVKDEN